MSDADEVERHPCPRCGVQPGSPCWSRSGVVTTAYHTGRFTKVPWLAKELRVPTPADRGPGQPWRPGTPPPAPIPAGTPGADIRIGYARCSHPTQELQSQLDALAAAGIPGDKIFAEKVSTRVQVRPKFEAAQEWGHSRLLTFGGAYSNHICATAAAGYYGGFSTLGVIRGEEHVPLNWALRHAVSLGMQFIYMDRATYRRKREPDVIASLHEAYGDFYLLPEGGSNELAVRGCVELTTELTIDFDVICCPVGTGGTLAGIAAGLSPGRRALGFAALKGGQFLDDDVAELQRRQCGSVGTNWSIDHDFHFGGFAKATSELHGFIDDFERRHSLRLDWIYVAKMMYGLFSLVEQGVLGPETVVVAVITGPADSEKRYTLR